MSRRRTRPTSDQPLRSFRLGSYAGRRGGQSSRPGRELRGDWGLRSAASPQRRLLRLVVALFLVILLMQQAADPRLYRHFFDSLGTPLVITPPGYRAAASPGQTTASPGQPTGDALPVVPSGRQPTREELRAVSDATLWKATDAPVFEALLARAERQDYAPYGDPPVLVGYAALENQADLYRGSTVALAGQVVRCEPQTGKTHGMEIESYWLLWVRPLDGSDRPVMLYSPTLPQELREVTRTGVDSEGPRGIATGIYLRRHLFAAAKGSQLAPVLIGHWTPEPREESVASNRGEPRGVEENRSLWIQLGCVAGGASLFALALTWWLARSSEKEHQRQRSMRQQGMQERIEIPDLRATQTPPEHPAPEHPAQKPTR